MESSQTADGSATPCGSHGVLLGNMQGSAGVVRVRGLDARVVLWVQIPVLRGRACVLHSSRVVVSCIWFHHACYVYNEL